MDSVRSDEQFLAFLDDDMNRQIRTDEVKRAVGWFLGMMNDFSGFEAESDVLELSAIDAASPEGARLLDAAKLVLSNIGRETDGRLSLAQIRNDKEIIACARQNGDGIIPPGAADTPETAELVNSAMKLFGSIKDICGAEGIDSAILDQFTAAATAYVNWVDAPAANPAALKPFGDDTAASYGKFSALEKELDDYFIACEARVFSREAPDRLRKVESTIDLLNNQAIPGTSSLLLRSRSRARTKRSIFRRSSIRLNATPCSPSPPMPISGSFWSETLSPTTTGRS